MTGLIASPIARLCWLRRARNRSDFEDNLRIRYHDGVVEWRERNHNFFEWGEHNVANGFCDYLHMDGEVEITKTVYWHRELGKRHFRMTVFPRKVFLANRDRLADGDIVGFVTRRRNLDFFHIDFVIFPARVICCCGMRQGPNVACSMNGWNTSVQSTGSAMSRCCGRGSGNRSE